MSRISGNLAWLGVVPAHWKVLKLRQVLSPFSEKNHSDMPLLSVVREKGVIIRNVEGENHNYVPDDLSGYKLVRRGQFAVNKMKAWQGSYGVSKYDGIVSPAYFVFDIRYDMAEDFFNRAIRSKAYVSYFGQASDGIRVGQWDLSMQRMKEIPFLLPPRAEQDQIVRFLDWKVSLINRLINLKKKEIGEILQIRQNAITKKLSGEEVWLKRLVLKPMQYGANSSGTELNPNFPRYIRITDIDSMGNLKDEGAKSIELSEAEPYILQKGDILLARSGATVGKAFMYKREHGYCAYAGYLIRVKLNPKLIIPEYFMYFTNSSIYANWKDRTFIQATIQNISAERYGRLPVPLPSLDVQMETIDILNSICGRIDALVMNYRKEIRVLEEYRTRLISDVVTGKIDVRDVKIPDYEYVEEDADTNAVEDSESETEEQEEV